MKTVSAATLNPKKINLIKDMSLGSDNEAVPSGARYCLADNHVRIAFEQYYSYRYAGVEKEVVSRGDVNLPMEFVFDLIIEAIEMGALKIGQNQHAKLSDALAKGIALNHANWEESK